MSATELVRERAQVVSACDEARARGLRIALVPTMGALHEGHLSLVAHARTRGASYVVVTIFVNPLQFAPHEDLERYPRTLADDLEKLRALGVDLVFAPEHAAMFPRGFQTHVEVEGLSAPLEGVHRPGHLRGVTTIVAKLFELAAPCMAVFGRKDYQQWKVIERMALDLDQRVEVLSAPIVREPDGLALSSRNRYLDPDARARALGLSRGLRAASRAFAGGERDAGALLAAARAPIARAFDRVDYVALVEPETLSPIEGRVAGRALVLAAAHLGATRLIDNALLGEDAL